MEMKPHVINLSVSRNVGIQANSMSYLTSHICDAQGKQDKAYTRDSFGLFLR
jgi:hypothetical protein